MKLIKKLPSVKSHLVSRIISISFYAARYYTAALVEIKLYLIYPRIVVVVDATVTLRSIPQYPAA